MRKTFVTILSLCLFFGAQAAHADDYNYEIPEIDVLSGDKKLACEAVLCLSTSSRPSECNSSIKKYYSIHKRKLSDTRKARKNFLKLCPSSSEQGMPSLVDAIVNGAGYCDAEYLNQQTTIYYRLYDFYSKSWMAWKTTNPNENYTTGYYAACPENPSKYSSWAWWNNVGAGDGASSQYCVQKRAVVEDVPNSNCINLINHEFTDYSGLKYVGDKFNGGKWVEQ